MTALALVFVPIVIAYKIWVYRLFRAPVGAEETMGEWKALAALDPALYWNKGMQREHQQWRRRP
jgi:hypothetical protein